MKLVFQGLVTTGDAYRCDDEDKHGSVFVGGADVVNEIEDAGFKGPVTVAIADERFTGDLEVETGWGYSEYTPMDSDNLQVGGHDLRLILERHEGKEITVWIADEPVNVLADLPSSEIQPTGKEAK